MTVLGSLGPHFVALCKGLLGSFSIDDGNGSENEFPFFSIFVAFYSNLLKMASVGEFPWELIS